EPVIAAPHLDQIRAVRTARALVADVLARLARPVNLGRRDAVDRLVVVVGEHVGTREVRPARDAHAVTAAAIGLRVQELRACQVDPVSLGGECGSDSRDGEKRGKRANDLAHEVLLPLRRSAPYPLHSKRESLRDYHLTRTPERSEGTSLNEISKPRPIG